MSNVIEFLEWMGRDASWRTGQEGDIELAVANAELSPAAKAALLTRDSHALEELLGAGSNLCCLVHNPDDDEDEEEEEGDDEEEEVRVRAVS
jgi:hypothetical protein